MTKLTTILLTGITALSFTACGGGGSSSGGGGTTPPVTEEVINEGGEPSNPTPISFSLPNKIDSNTFYNHYTYSGKTGDELIIHVELDSELTQREEERCRMHRGNGGGGAGSPDVHIVITEPSGIIINHYDGCQLDMVYTVNEDGEHKIHFNYPNGHSGEAFVDKI